MLKLKKRSPVIMELRASVAFFERMMNLMRRYIGWEIVFLAYTLVNCLTIGLIGVSSGDPQRVLYLVIGAILWGFLSLIFHELSENIAWERWEGTIEHTLMAPILRATHLAGNCIATVIYGLARTALILVVVSMFLKVNLGNANLFAASVILAVSSLSFIGLGLIGGILPLLSPEKGPQATHIIQALILLVSGVYYEIEVLPRWLQFFSKISPATYTLKAMRLALLEGKGISDLKGYIIILLVMGIVLIPIGYIGFRIAENYARRAGKLSRSG
ncbi:MAG: ABC transporter permease [Candidatus Eremiobacteraeota bacterium]|nr:ABC transporter permease [Candidatus Eremiobacteraeota bacterium]